MLRQQPKTAPCDTCGKTLNLEDGAYTYHSLWRQDEFGKNGHWVVHAFCSPECDNKQPVYCKICNKATTKGEAYDYQFSSCGDEFHHTAYCSIECYRKQVKKEKIRRALGEVRLFVLEILPLTACIIFISYVFKKFWPDPNSILLSLMFPSGLLTLGSALMLRKMDGYVRDLFGLCWFLPFAVIAGASSLAFISMHVYNGMALWLK